MAEPTSEGELGHAARQRSRISSGIPVGRANGPTDLRVPRAVASLGLAPWQLTRLLLHERFPTESTPFTGRSVAICTVPSSPGGGRMGKMTYTL